MILSMWDQLETQADLLPFLRSTMKVARMEILSLEIFAYTI